MAKSENDSEGFIFTPYITVKGKRRYHPTGGVFKIPIEKLKKKIRRK